MPSFTGDASNFLRLSRRPMPNPARLLSAAKRLRLALVALGLIAAPLALRAQIPAFPGAEGAGAYATGGRGGDVYYVTNLNASGAGSFADAIATVPSSGRTIVFAVSGYIRFPSGSNGTRLASSKVTIAGQTAPGDGIGFYNNFFRISGSDIVVRHLRFRHGYYGSGGDCIDLDSASKRSVFDHVAMQFSTDENMSSFSSPPDYLTLQYSLNAWGLESHSCGGLWDQNNATAIFNLWAHNHTRNPKARPIGLLEWVNNVTFDWDIGFILGDSDTPIDWKANVIGNYFVCPPGNLRSVALEKAGLDRNGVPNFTIHVADNLFDKNGNTILDGSDYGYGIASGSYATAATRMPANGGRAVTPVSPRLAYKRVVSNAGPLRTDALSGIPLRDEVDTVLLDNLVNFRRNHISKESALPVSNAGFGTLNSGPAPLDTDRDGMSDAFESALGWNVSVQDHNTALASSGGIITGTTFFPANTPAGYTRLEEYLHFLASPHATVSRNTTAEPSAITLDLSRYTLGFNTLSPTFTLAGVVGGSAVQSGAGGRTVVFTPTLNTAGRARFEFTVTDSQGDAWTQSMLILVSSLGAPRSLVWKGDATTNAWTTANTTLNWLKADGSSVAFASGDNALFDDRGSATPALALAANLAAGPVTFDTAKNHTLTGAGALTVGGPLTKRGSGNLTISNNGSNSFGSVVHEAGGLAITKSGALGGAKIQLNGGNITFSPDVVGSTVANALEFNAPTVITATTQHNVSGAWTGSGDVTINTSAMWTIVSTWSGYSGRIGFGPSASFRLNGSSNTNFGSKALAIDLGSGSTQFYNRNGNLTIDIGSLTGGPNTKLLGAQTGTVASTYSIGGRGENATFQGAILNGAANATTALTHITKVGVGTWTLTGNSTHTGNTTVSVGNLRLNGAFSASPISVSANATLSGVGSSGALVTVNSGAKVSPGATDGAAGVFTAAGGLNAASGSTLVFDLGPTPASSADKITVSAGTFTLGAAVNAQINFLDLVAGLAPGTYPLVDGASTLSASGSVVTLLLPAAAGTTRQTFSVGRPASGSAPAYLDLVVAGSAAALAWSGPDGGIWDLNTSSGNFSGGPTSTFFNLDRVVFDDSAPGGAVSLAGTLQPAALVFNNSLKSFTLGGDGVLSGPMKLVKNGAGSVLFANTAAYAFTGGVDINAGTLVLGSATSPLGTGVVRLNGGTLQLPNAATFLTNSFVFSGNSAIVSPYAGNTNLPNATTNTFTSVGSASVDISGVAGILSINSPMDGFSGAINWGAGSGMLRLNATNSSATDVNRGSASTHFALGTGSGKLVNRNGGLVIELGAVSGGPSTRLEGRQSGSGDTSTTYRVGGLGSDTAFAGAIHHGGDLAGIQIVKTGAGRWTLSGSSDYTGSLEIEAGRVLLTGTLACSGAAKVSPAGALQLSGGLLRAEAVNIDAGGLLTGLGSIDGDLNNRGTVTAHGAGSLAVSGDVVNDGVLRLTGGASLSAAGAFVNNGVLDLLTAGGSLPPNLVNNGVVIDSSAARLSSWTREGDAFTLRIASYPGHTYTLQTTQDLAAGWTDLETQNGADGVELAFTHDAGPAPRRFYRIAIGP